MSTGSGPGRPTLFPAEVDDARLSRAVDLFRFAALGYAIVLHTMAQDEYLRPWAAWGVLAVLTAWSIFLSLHRGRGPVVMIADLALAAVAVLSTRVLDDPERIAAGAQTLPTIWSAAAVLGWAVRLGWRGGLVAAATIAVADLLELAGLTTWSVTTFNNIVLLFLLGLVVGYAAELVRVGRAEMAAAVAQRAATAERERLARDIHDSVLQVLGFVHRDGIQRGGPAAELGRLAGEQEVRLRALISNGPIVATGPGESDLSAALARRAGERINVSCPADPVMLPVLLAEALEAAASAALDNVRRHAGDEARAWVLLEDEPGQVTVTVRDDGPGLAPERMVAARAEGRLGISSSICGRIQDVGGTVEIIGIPGQGTEVELRVPRPIGVEASNRRVR